MLVRYFDVYRSFVFHHLRRNKIRQKKKRVKKNIRREITRNKNNHIKQAVYKMAQNRKKIWNILMRGCSNLSSPCLCARRGRKKFDGFQHPDCRSTAREEKKTTPQNY